MSTAIINGALGEIRTPDPLVRSQVLYPAELRAHTKNIKLAESEGFEPSIGDKPYTPLAGARLRPLGHLSGTASGSSRLSLLLRCYRCKGRNSNDLIEEGKELFEGLALIVNTSKQRRLQTSQPSR